ncbi:MAG TPA: quercetin 2,3-dioxygenase [Candidatus Limnocylindrales bacterium]|nr:quercetin 2,3-dioxygenase [Candidatus Limnocylindrales bacterium]
MADLVTTDRRVVALGRGEGQSVWSIGGRFTVKADDATSDGRLALVEALAFRSTEPPLHVHHHEDEAWYVLDGQMTFYVADEAHVATAGSFVYAPMGLPHTFTVDVEPTRVLVLSTPAGFEHFALELGTAATDDERPADLEMPSPDVLGPIGERYGIEVVGPPYRVAHSEGG